MANNRVFIDQCCIHRHWWRFRKNQLQASVQHYTAKTFLKRIDMRHWAACFGELGFHRRSKLQINSGRNPQLGDRDTHYMAPAWLRHQAAFLVRSALIAGAGHSAAARS